MPATHLNAWLPASFSGEALTLHAWHADTGVRITPVEGVVLVEVDVVNSPGRRRATLIDGANGLALVRIYKATEEVAVGYSEPLAADEGEYWLDRAGPNLIDGLTAGAIAQLAGARIEVTAPTLTAAGMTRAIVRGRAYTGGNRLTFAISGYQGRSLATATAIRLHALANHAGATEAWSLDHDELVVVDSEAGDYLLYFAATATQTAAAEASEYRFGIDAEFAAGDPEAVLDPLHRLRVLSPATV